MQKSDSTHSSSKGAVYFLTGLLSKKTWLFEAVVFLGQSEDGTEPGCEVSRIAELSPQSWDTRALLPSGFYSNL